MEMPPYRLMFINHGRVWTFWKAQTKCYLNMVLMLFIDWYTTKDRDLIRQVMKAKKRYLGILNLGQSALKFIKKVSYPRILI